MPCNLGEFYTHYYISCVKRVSKKLTFLYKIDFETSTGGWGFPGGAVVKNPPCNAGDTGLIPGSGRSHEPWDTKPNAPQLWSLCSKVCTLQPLIPGHPRARARQRDARTRQPERSPRLQQLEKACRAAKTQHGQELNKYFF